MTATNEIRAQFPILSHKVNGYPLVYFDNAATTQKPQRVLDAMNAFYTSSCANIHRGVHTLSREATELYENARQTLARHFNAGDSQQIIFTAGTTDSINLVAQGLAISHLKSGDEILLATSEHHSNILPWQAWAKQNKGTLRALPLREDHSVDISGLDEYVTDRTKVIAIAQVSNTLGTHTDVKQIIDFARKRGIPVLIDGAQSAPHMKIDLQDLDPDFFVCSAHKMYGPTGSGMLYMSSRWLNELPAVRTGGGTIKTVSFDNVQYAEGALRFEPGTPNVAGAIGFAEALRFMDDVGMDNILVHEKNLTGHAAGILSKIREIELYGNTSEKSAVISFNVKGAHPFDAGTLLDKFGIAVRTGHHCTQPLMECLGIPGTVRISFALYNTIEEIDFFASKLERTIEMLR